MELLRIARTPILATIETRVLDALRLMAENHVGVVVVTDPDKRALGVFTERDSILRVVLPGRDPTSTMVTEVMTSPAVTELSNVAPTEALTRMVRNNLSYLPVIDRDAQVVGLVTLPQLLMRRVSELQGSLQALSSGRVLVQSAVPVKAGD